MLSPSQREEYKSLIRAIETLQVIFESPQSDRAAIAEQLQQVKQVFQTQVMALTPTDVAPEFRSRWQSLQTEMYRTLRLLQTDLNFWQAARQGSTASQRQQAVRDRLDQLLGYARVPLENED